MMLEQVLDHRILQLDLQRQLCLGNRALHGAGVCARGFLTAFPHANQRDFVYFC